MIFSLWKTRRCRPRRRTNFCRVGGDRKPAAAHRFSPGRFGGSGLAGGPEAGPAFRDGRAGIGFRRQRSPERASEKHRPRSAWALAVAGRAWPGSTTHHAPVDPHPHRPRRPLADAAIFPGDHLGQSAVRLFRAQQLLAVAELYQQSLRPVAAPLRAQEASFPASGFVPESLEKRFTLESFFPLPMGFSSDAALARGLPAGALATTQDPGDFLNAQRHAQPHQLRRSAPAGRGPDGSAPWHARHAPADGQRAIGDRQFGELPGLLTDPGLYIRNDLNNQTADQDVTLFESSSTGESLPRLTAANCLIGVEPEAFARPVGPPLVGTRRFDWYLTDAAGTVTFTSAPRFAVTRLQAFDFDTAGVPAGTGREPGRGPRHGGRLLPGSRPADPLRALQVARLDCYGLFDPRYLDVLDRIDVLDARRLDRAGILQRLRDRRRGRGVFPARHPVATAHRAGRGEQPHAADQRRRRPSLGHRLRHRDLAAIGAMPSRNVLDLEALNGAAAARLQRFGISSQLINDLHDAAIAKIPAARTPSDRAITPPSSPPPTPPGRSNRRSIRT